MKIIFLGAPGCGKGTISNAFVEKYGFKHVSTGDLFREVITKKKEHHEELKTILMSGNLVDDNLTNTIVKSELLKLCSQNENFILDGYPRNLLQAQFLDKITVIDYVININVDKDILIKRIVGRRICPVCKSIYNIYFKKPIYDGICDKDGELLVQRNDDNAEVAAKRLEVFKNENKILVNYYTKQKKIFTIDNVDVDSSVQKICNICKIV